MSEETEVTRMVDDFEDAKAAIEIAQSLGMAMDQMLGAISAMIRPTMTKLSYAGFRIGIIHPLPRRCRAHHVARKYKEIYNG